MAGESQSVLNRDSGHCVVMLGGAFNKKLRKKSLMKHTNWWVAALALAGGLALADSARAQGTTVVSDFHNFNLSVTYANWDPNAWSFSAPVITSGPLSYRVVAQGYGSG